MTRNKNQKFDEHEKKITEAIEAVKQNPNAKISHIARAHQVNRATLYNRLSGRMKNRKMAHAGQQLVEPEEEKAIVDKILEWDERGAPPKHSNVAKMATSVIQGRGTPAEAIPGDHLVTRFIRRHEEISTKIAHPMDRDRIYAMDQKKISEHFEKLRDVISRHKILPEDMWNDDETGLSMGVGSHHRELAVASSQRKAAHTAQAGKGQWVTLIGCVSAAGARLPGFYIYEGSAHYLCWYNESVDDRIGFAYSDNGWTNDEIGLRWLKEHFNKHATPSAPGRKRTTLPCDLSP
jgi:transposase-like protein